MGVLHCNLYFMDLLKNYHCLIMTNLILIIAIVGHKIHFYSLRKIDYFRDLIPNCFKYTLHIS